MNLSIGSIHDLGVEKRLIFFDHDQNLGIWFAIDVAVAQLTFRCVVETQLENPQTKWRFLAG